VSDAAARGVVRPAGHPLRQALDALAAQSSAPATAPAGQAAAPIVQAAPGSLATPSPASVATPAVPPTPPADGSQEARFAGVSRLDVSATVPPGAANNNASDTGSSGGGSSDSAGENAAASAIVRAMDLRFDVPAAAAVQQPGMATVVPDAVTAGTVAALSASSALGPTPFTAIDLPAAARFEQALSSLDPDVRNLQAMVRTVRLFAGGSGATEARLTLEPEHLGPIGLTVRVEQGSVSAHFRADTPAAHRWIETHQHELRTGLRDQGLEVKEFVVTTDPDGRRDRREDAQPPRPARPRRAQTADSPRFEVLA
jgi:flagellar hook-length control protein FliK